MLTKVRKTAAVFAAATTASIMAAYGAAAADANVILTVHPVDGGTACDYTMSSLETFGLHVIEATVHWTDGRRFEGPLIKDILSACRSADAASVQITALNDYSAVIPRSDFNDWPVILATKMDGQRVAIRDKGPLMVIYPYDEDADLQNHVYYGRSVWQVRSIDAVAP